MSSTDGGDRDWIDELLDDVAAFERRLRAGPKVYRGSIAIGASQEPWRKPKNLKPSCSDIGLTVKTPPRSPGSSDLRNPLSTISWPVNGKNGIALLSKQEWQEEWLNRRKQDPSIPYKSFAEYLRDQRRRAGW